MRTAIGSILICPVPEEHSQEMEGIMRVRILSLALIAAASLISQIAAGQQVKSPVVGVISSGGPVTCADNNGSVVLSSSSGWGPLTKKVFVMTQACCDVSSGTGAQRFFVGGDHAAYIFVNAQQSFCQTFEPGIVISTGVDVRCAVHAAAGECSVTGIVTQAQ